MTALVLIELDGGGPGDAPLRAVSLARSLGDVGAVVFADAAPADALARYGVTDVYLIESGSLDGYAPQAWARTLAGLATETGATAVLAAGTDRGHEVLAHLGGAYRPAHGGELHAGHPGRGPDAPAGPAPLGRAAARGRGQEAPVALFTVATDGRWPLFPPRGRRLSRCMSTSRSWPRRTWRYGRWNRRPGAGGASLATARVVVGGGRGVGGADGFAPLEELAGLLGGVVGVSRVVTSEGWRPHKQQVGQTGTKITPELYLACGISGAIQHIAGCAGAKHIIAINTDPGAPILAHADYAVIGDLHQVIPALVEALRAR